MGGPGTRSKVQNTAALAKVTLSPILFGPVRRVQAPMHQVFPTAPPNLAPSSLEPSATPALLLLSSLPLPLPRPSSHLCSTRAPPTHHTPKYNQDVHACGSVTRPRPARSCPCSPWPRSPPHPRPDTHCHFPQLVLQPNQRTLEQAPAWLCWAQLQHPNF